MLAGDIAPLAVLAVPRQPHAPSHLGLATRPSAGKLDRLTWSQVLRPGQLEVGKDVLGAGRRPQSEEMVVGVGEDTTSAHRHEAGVPGLGEDHGGRQVTGTVSGGRRSTACCAPNNPAIRDATALPSTMQLRTGFAPAAHPPMKMPNRDESWG